MTTGTCIFVLHFVVGAVKVQGGTLKGRRHLVIRIRLPIMETGEQLDTLTRKRLKQPICLVRYNCLFLYIKDILINLGCLCVCVYIYIDIMYFNPLTPNEDYSGRTAPLTSKRCILYIYSTNIGTEYFKHGIYCPFFPLQNAVCFINLTCLVPVLFTFYIQSVLKLKK